MQDPATTFTATMEMEMQMQFQQGIIKGGVAPQLGEEEQVVKCPRCESSNTKFCYYNNYNLSQPRHFCKSCRRYWTKGGALRNIPVGGSSRKRSASSSAFTPSKRTANAIPSRAPEPKPEPEDSSVVGVELPVQVEGGIYTSLLVGDGQLGNLLGDTATDSGPCWEASPAAATTTTGGGGNSISGGVGAWPDLAIFTTPTSGFHL